MDDDLTEVLAIAFRKDDGLVYTRCNKQPDARTQANQPAEGPETENHTGETGGIDQESER
jgi:hypothetical protein